MCRESGLQVYVLGLLTIIDHNKQGQGGICKRYSFQRGLGKKTNTMRFYAQENVELPL